MRIINERRRFRTRAKRAHVRNTCVMDTRGHTRFHPNGWAVIMKQLETSTTTSIDGPWRAFFRVSGLEIPFSRPRFYMEYSFDNCLLDFKNSSFRKG